MSKSDLSPAELSVICDESFLMHKVSIGEKINQIFRELKSRIAGGSQSGRTDFPQGLDLQGGKISHGENYKGLAWRVLDYPAAFKKEDIFAFRTMMLWGRGFYFHLILSGSYLALFEEKIRAHAVEIQEAGWKISQQKSPWEWEFDQNSHSSPHPFPESFAAKGFIKLSQHRSLSDFSKIPDEGCRLWLQLMDLLFIKRNPQE